MASDIFKLAKSMIPSLIVILVISCANQEEMLKGSSNDQTVEGQNTNDQTMDAPATDEVIHYLALGDSYTIGQGVKAKHRWPNQLGEALKKRKYNVKSIDIIAQTGWTTSNLLYAIDNTDLGDCNLVSLLIGVNNQYQGQSFETFKTEFDLLLDKSIDIAGDAKRVFVISIPDYGVTSLGSSNSIHIGQEIDKYNDYMSDVCAYRKIPFINITEISRALGDSEDVLAADGLHPSGSQYAAWVNNILPVAVEVLHK